MLAVSQALIAKGAEASTDDPRLFPTGNTHQPLLSRFASYPLLSAQKPPYSCDDKSQGEQQIEQRVPCPHLCFLINQVWKQELQLSLPLCMKCPSLVEGQTRAGTQEVVKWFLPGKGRRGHVYEEFAYQQAG